MSGDAVLAADPVTAPEVLAGLVGSPDPAVRLLVAAHRACPPAALLLLRFDPVAEVRDAAVR